MNGLDQQTAGTRYAQLGAQIEDLALVLEAVNQAGLSNVATALRRAETFTLERVDTLRGELADVKQVTLQTLDALSAFRDRSLWGRLCWLVKGA